MKTTLLLGLAVVLGMSVSAQKKFVTKQSTTAKPNASLMAKPLTDEPVNLNAGYTPYARPAQSTKSAPGVVETVIGSTRYDNQTNASLQNRIYAYPDGTVAATWIFGQANPNFADRGTGYNYFDGALWNDEPTARIETNRNGWSSYTPVGDGEMVVTHNGSTGLIITKRPVRGTGAWTSSVIVGPTVGGTTALLWPRAIANGNTVHILACTDDGSYMGLSRALVYYRSDDGGANFAGPTIIPGLDAASLGIVNGGSFTGFDGDAYNWAAPKNNTIAFVAGDQMGGAWIMKSVDDGLNWTKSTIFTVPVITTAPYEIFASHDNSLSIALDNNGDAHVVFGLMRASDDDFVTAGNSYYPYTDGLIYWNENMPQLDTTQLNDYDVLEANGNLLAYMIDYNGDDEINFPEVASQEFAFGLYGSSLSSMAQIVIDDSDNMFVSYSACREDLINAGAQPNAQLYRHLYMVSKMNYSLEWSDPRDLTDDLEHSFDECVYGSLSYTIDDKLHLVFMMDPEPGTAIGSDLDEYTDNFITYLTFPTFVGTKPVTMAADISVSPNPAYDFTNVQVSLMDSRKVEINIYDAMGKMVASNDFGMVNSGNHNFKVNTASLTSGIYLFSIKTGESLTTKKVIVK